MPPFDAERLARLAREQRIDVVQASTRHNVRYLTGGYYLHFFARAPRFGGGRYLSFAGIPVARPASAFYVGRRDEIMDEQHYIDAFGPFWITERHWVPRGPGVRCGELWRVGTEAITARPGAEYGRFLAHGLGMVSHEPPAVARDSTRPLEAGMVLSLEAEVRHPAIGHIKIEDGVLVTANGCEGLGDVDREWCIA